MLARSGYFPSDCLKEYRNYKIFVPQLKLVICVQEIACHVTALMPHMPGEGINK